MVKISSGNVFSFSKEDRECLRPKTIQRKSQDVAHIRKEKSPNDTKYPEIQIMLPLTFDANRTIVEYSILIVTQTRFHF